jgi:hypothetical protein
MHLLLMQYIKMLAVSNSVNPLGGLLTILVNGPLKNLGLLLKRFPFPLLFSTCLHLYTFSSGKSFSVS